MADKPKLKLDKAGLQGFIDHQVTDLQNFLDQVANKDDEENGVAMSTLLDGKSDSADGIFLKKEQRPLSIGILATEHSYVDCAAAVTKITESAQSIIDVYAKQTKLLTHLSANLSTTIDKLIDGQHETLMKIDGKNFLDDLGSVSADFQDTGGDSGDSGKS